jgi:hypothetical protein
MEESEQEEQKLSSNEEESYEDENTEEGTGTDTHSVDELIKNDLFRNTQTPHIQSESSVKTAKFPWSQKESKGDNQEPQASETDESKVKKRMAELLAN